MFKDWPGYDERQTQKAIINTLQDLQQEKAKDEAIINSIGDGLIITAPDGKIVMVNKAAEDMLGWKQEDLLGKLFAQISSAADENGNILTPENRPLQKVLTSRQKIVNKTLYYKKKDGSLFPVGITAAPIMLEEKMIGTIEIFRDISREKEIDRMKTEFISLASHQLRTPLSAMKWFLEMLLNGDAGELEREQKEFIENINNANERMISLVGDLLNISRIESGRLMIESESTDMKALINEVCQEVSNKVTGKKQILEVHLSDSLPGVSIDPKLISQVYINLLTNANKYSPAGAKITISIYQKDGDIVSEISDTGYGIPARDQDKLFQKFYRGENILKLETDGTGLGLYLVKSIIDASKGKIWFKSEENKGTTFWFSLPLAGTPSKKGEVTLDIKNK